MHTRARPIPHAYIFNPLHDSLATIDFLEKTGNVKKRHQRFRSGKSLSDKVNKNGRRQAFDTCNIK